ncbi:hypothetical protein [Bifidobacterium tibiigranuli]|nr:hypothetical protein [Bifidobacterium tibiigranuli]MCI1649415.1 hypothetical protein [Bifidobacterium tibiigranuli]MCI2185884.1 hypothetical protein [Bifidobacterium tibiigranuli]MCI2204655.1 hypothetical protein [Bifidobacterium tibiigranuli]
MTRTRRNPKTHETDIGEAFIPKNNASTADVSLASYIDLGKTGSIQI